MTIDDKTRTELEAAVFRRLVDHLRARTDVQNIDLMNLAGFCRNCLSNWMKEEADAKGVAVSKDESREAVYGMPYEEWKAKHQGTATPGAVGRDEEGPPRALIANCSVIPGWSEGPDPDRNFAHAQYRIVVRCFASPRNDGFRISCGRAVDERDVALTQGPSILRVILEKAPCGNACGA